MKTYRIQLDPVEEAMLREVQKVLPDYKDLRRVLINQINQAYVGLPNSRGKTSR